MPVDQFGNRAELLFDDASIVRRMNTGNLWEHEMNAVLDQFRRKMSGYWDDGIDVETMWFELMDFYKVVSPAYHEIISNGIFYELDRKNHIYEFIHAKTGLYLPFGSVRVGSEHSLAIHDHYPLDYGKVKMWHPAGGYVDSKSNVLISKMYIMCLEKIGENWAATSVPRRQHHGVISKLSAETKVRLPYRNQSIRFGETEFRNLMATADPSFAVSLITMANSTELTNLAIHNLLTAEDPSRVVEVIPYDQLHNYPSVAIERISHLMSCYGLRYVYDDERETIYQDAPDLGVDISNFEFSGDDDE